MSIYVSEIGVRIAVGDPQGGRPSGPRPGPGDQAPSGPALTAIERTALIEETTRNVLRTLSLMERR